MSQGPFCTPTWGWAWQAAACGPHPGLSYFLDPLPWGAGPATVPSPDENANFTPKKNKLVAGSYEQAVRTALFLECSPPTMEARVRFPAGTCQYRMKMTLVKSLQANTGGAGGGKAVSASFPPTAPTERE
jgi:hypothetical protein